MDREGSRNGHLYAASLSGGDSIGCDDTVVGEQHIIRCGDVEITAFSCSVLCSTSYPGQSSAARIDPDVSGTNGNLSALGRTGGRSLQRAAVHDIDISIGRPQFPREGNFLGMLPHRHDPEVSSADRHEVSMVDHDVPPNDADRGW
ncbi:MAG: hypothetical protein AW06_000052 [Candidatus Accumulibacter cognatus]|uniref:Uncharacterized protein n=1 Tax=Candidatus Accumulibacter cognatus TaxID=2954383 RepID=A0A080MLM8_9PROT|nr:MAG: hypothetical protein AW06_000052 [Candidatus Accumulibacter cognatus]